MTIALRKLGYNPYHGSECFKNPPHDFNLWIEAMECNFLNHPKPRYNTEDFDRLIGAYDAVMDIPACLFWEDLSRAYPDAKIILTTRDVNSWYTSANATVFKFMRIPFFRFWHRMDSTVLGPLFRQSELVWKIFCGNDYEESVVKQAYLDHYDRIRAAIPQDRLLEFETGKSGWKELCEFLDEPVPDEPWPKAYPTVEFQHHMDLAMEDAIRTIVRWVAVFLLVGIFPSSTMPRDLWLLLALAASSVADIPPLYQSHPYDIGAFDRWPHQLYHSSNAIGPILNYHNKSEGCFNDDLYTVLPYWGKQVNIPGLMLVDAEGYLTWHSTRYVTGDVQAFQGEDYIVALAMDSTYYALINNRYEEAYQIRVGRGWNLDAHELTLTPDGTALLVFNGVIRTNETSFDAPPGVEFLLESGIQEIDVLTGEVVFEWRASEHFKFEEYYHFQSSDGRTETTAPDLFHINSIEKDALGNFLISCRMMSSVVYVDGKTGDVIWKLGGKGNSFKDLSNGAASFNGQHHARFHDHQRKISIFDNGNCPGRPVTGPTRGIILLVDTENMTVNLEQEYISPNKVLTDNSGSMQILNNGNVVLGFGPNANWAEYASNGTLLCNTHMGPETWFNSGEIRSYRISKSAWVADPPTRPDIALVRDRAYASWNGATEVSEWVLNGVEGEIQNPDDAYVLGQYPKLHFETDIPIPDTYAGGSLFVSALDRDGNILGSSRVVQWQPTVRPGLISQA
ncbi:unnamed protein product [Penicillium olsonii]|nr:unnamed protein product [Penicillium olsonii]